MVSAACLLVYCCGCLGFGLLRWALGACAGFGLIVDWWGLGFLGLRLWMLVWVWGYDYVVGFFV